ncbi:MAG: sodium-translocating pyrophosphatase [Candidatus Eisenbacteria bacterium]
MGEVPVGVAIAIGGGALGLLFAVYLAFGRVMNQDQGNDRMKEISGYIREGAMAFLGREYRNIAIFIVAMVVLLMVGGLGWGTAVAFFFGAACSMVAGFVGMRIATAANARTAAAARTSFNAALLVAFPGGAVMGMTVAGLGLFGLTLLLTIYWKLHGLDLAAADIAGFSMGASSVALFARVGGGIYTKAADVGADLVGKVEAGIPEDDPRNPGVIADNVGDNVGDVAGLGADLFESFVGAIISAIVIAHSVTEIPTGDSISYVCMLAAVGILASIIGVFFVRMKEGGNPQAALRNGTVGAGICFVAGAAGVSFGMFPQFGMNYFLATVGGLFAGMAVGFVAEFYTSGKSVQRIAEASQTGSATNIIAGFGTGMRSAVLPLILIALSILLAFSLAGSFGIALAALGMLATTGMTVAVDAYGPIADNAGGIAEMSHLPPDVRKRTDALDAAGNTTAAIGKGFAIGSAALTALALFTAYREAVVKAMQATDPTFTEFQIDVTDVYVLVGLLVGGVVPYIFAADTMNAVGRAAMGVVNEVRRQFKDIPGLLEGKAGVKADYARCVDITTQAALKEMVGPGILAVAIPLVMGIIFGPKTLAGVLAGSLISGVPLALLLANAGGAWDNAKKYVEEGHFGGKGSDTHKAAVVGDTVGDPFKDTSGPALNILLKLMAIVSLVFAPLIIKLHGMVAGLF